MEDNKQYEYISKTEALKKYHLNKNDIEELDYKEKVNPHYRSGPKMRLYKLDDIEKIFMDKYNVEYHDIMIRVEELDEIRKRRSDNIKRKRMIRENERKEKLSEALKSVGLVIRNDSRLCQNYISGELNNLEYIKKKMCQMKYLHEYIDIRKYKKRAKEEFSFLKSIYGYVNIPFIDLVEEEFLKENEYPDVYPWLE